MAAGKKAFGVATTNYMASLNGNCAIRHRKETLGTTLTDKEILEMAGGVVSITGEKTEDPDGSN